MSILRQGWLRVDILEGRTRCRVVWVTHIQQPVPELQHCPICRSIPWLSRKSCRHESYHWWTSLSSSLIDNGFKMRHGYDIIGTTLTIVKIEIFAKQTKSFTSPWPMTILWRPPRSTAEDISVGNPNVSSRAWLLKLLVCLAIAWLFRTMAVAFVVFNDKPPMPKLPNDTCNVNKKWNNDAIRVRRRKHERKNDNEKLPKSNCPEPYKVGTLAIDIISVPRFPTITRSRTHNHNWYTFYYSFAISIIS